MNADVSDDDLSKDFPRNSGGGGGKLVISPISVKHSFQFLRMKIIL